MVGRLVEVHAVVSHLLRFLVAQPASRHGRGTAPSGAEEEDADAEGDEERGAGDDGDGEEWEGLGAGGTASDRTAGW